MQDVPNRVAAKEAAPSRQNRAKHGSSVWRDRRNVIRCAWRIDACIDVSIVPRLKVLDALRRKSADALHYLGIKRVEYFATDIARHPHSRFEHRSADLLFTPTDAVRQLTQDFPGPAIQQVVRLEAWKWRQWAFFDSWAWPWAALPGRRYVAFHPAAVLLAPSDDDWRCVTG
jgi:hypothetical protein